MAWREDLPSRPLYADMTQEGFFLVVLGYLRRETSDRWVEGDGNRSGYTQMNKFALRLLKMLDNPLS